jgi:nucleotide-binding universal stress UspA family protein
MLNQHAIAVAVDGSAASTAAVRWAASEAARRHADLQLVHVSEVNEAYLWSMPELPDYLRELGRPTVTRAIELARRIAPDIEMHERMLIGPAARMLLMVSETAPMVVLGRSGRGALASHLVGSTTYRMAAHAHCPVVIVPSFGALENDGPLEPDRIIVGLADRPTRGLALDFAIDEAARHRVPLQLVRTWQAAHASDRPDEQLEQMNALLAKHLTGRRAKVEASASVQAGLPAGVLSGLCRPGDLLVLGQHRHAPFLPPTVGKVVADCIQQAPCPVAVVPEPMVQAEQPERPRINEAGLIAY